MEEDNGFSVRDRRGSAEERQEQPRDSAAAAAGGKAGAAGDHSPETDFSSFIIFLATTAQMNLGSVPHPETGKTEVNTLAAKQMIDIIDMLKNKTKGNRTTEEETLLDQVLFNLRMHYVRVADEQKKSGGT